MRGTLQFGARVKLGTTLILLALVVGRCQCQSKKGDGSGSEATSATGKAGSEDRSSAPAPQSAKTEGSSFAESSLLARGKSVYMSNCVACHNVNPRSAGSIGPDVFGSSMELLTARIVNGSYPEGYKPKRSSKAMPPMPFLKDDIPALHAFLNQP